MQIPQSVKKNKKNLIVIHAFEFSEKWKQIFITKIILYSFQWT